MKNRSIPLWQLIHHSISKSKHSLRTSKASMETANIDRKRSKPVLSSREVLEIIYDRLGGKNWTRQGSWLDNEDISKWSGVTCNSDGEITALELSQNNLNGRLDEKDVLKALPPTIEQLWLSENQLSGNLPQELADPSRFPNLTILDVGSNQLKGALHPSFARATHFSWFDITGNELTSYFRYKENDIVSESVTSNSSSSPKPNIHVVESVLTREACQNLIDLAIQYTKENGGWETDRHRDYKTTDIDAAVVGGDLLAVCNDHLKQSLLPMLSHLFDLPISDLALEDLFLAKYCIDEQRSLPAHRDGSELSFVITLNDAFQGGGTQFIHDKITLAPKTPGTGVFFCGRLLHAGVEITEGTRYILAGFVRVYPSTPEACTKLKEIIESCKSKGDS